MSRLASITVSMPLPTSEENALEITELPRIVGELAVMLKDEAVCPEPPPVFWLSYESGQCVLNAKGEAPMDSEPLPGDKEKWNLLFG
jgi:hypothetical protein